MESNINTTIVMAFMVNKLMYKDYKEKHQGTCITKQPKISLDEIRARFFENKDIDIDEEINAIYNSGLFAKIETEDKKTYFTIS